MNNENHSENQTDRDLANSAWAEILEQRNQSTLSGNSEESKPVEKTVDASLAEKVNLSSELMDDLELDGQLRVLGKMSDSQNSFVDTVVAQTHAQSTMAKQSRPRLPILKPSFASEDTVLEDEEIIYATSADDFDDTSLVTLSRKVPRRGSVALFASLITLLLIGCFLGSMWWVGTASPTEDVLASKKTTGLPVPNEPAALPAPDEIAAKPDGSKVILDPSNDSQQDALETSSAVDADTNGFAIGEALADQSKDVAEDLVNAEGANEEGANDDSLTAATEGFAKNEWERIPNDPLDANSSLVDATRELDPAVESTESTESNLATSEDTKIVEDHKLYNADGVLWDSHLDWNLALQFHKNGAGSVDLNGKRLQAVILQDNAAFLLREISAQLQRRVGFLENRLGSKVNGSISVDGTSYSFDHISQLDETVEKVRQHITKLNIRLLSVKDLMTIRAGYREGIFANQKGFSSIDLSGKNLRFYTEDEVFTICSVLSSSEALLRDIAQKRLAWEGEEEIRLSEPTHKISIAPKAFLLFAKSGSLHLPDPIYSGQSIARIQDLYPSELLSMLQNAPSVNLFRNVQEFQEAKDYVYANGPPEMKMRLKIDKFERLLVKGSPLSEETQRLLQDYQARLARTLRSARGRATNPGDGIAMEPLFEVLAKRTDLQGLPLAMGDQCKSDTAEIHDLKQVSSSVGRTINRFNGSLGSRDMAQNDAFRNLTIKKMVSNCMQDHAVNPTSQKLKTIDQILQIDHPRLRLEMIESLRDSGTSAAVELMVNKAKFDLEPEVRIAAIEALKEIDPAQYRRPLLEGLNYPWHVVAEHSAEALVQLNDQDAIAGLIDMLDLPHPQFPIMSNRGLVQRELVGINHMRNCLLCHAPSISESDSVRGLIPHTSKPLPPLYYGSEGGTAVPFAVRADITYLEQDFSVVRPVENSGPWPSEQRFDYVVQKKKLTPKEAEQVARKINATPNRNRNAVIFALRELTGETPADNSSNNWRNIMATRKNKVE